MLRPVKPAPKRLEVVDRGDHVREKILFDSSAGVRVPAWLLLPKDLARGEKRPGILAAHRPRAFSETFGVGSDNYENSD